ncbi:BRO [Orgyia pseudotsugata single capsid nuclopolyhedrovirus]|nr:BRO [Orgyia pseudotsugata single capsid nuclopolyhedrovirus]
MRLPNLFPLKIKKRLKKLSRRDSLRPMNHQFCLATCRPRPSSSTEPACSQGMNAVHVATTELYYCNKKLNVVTKVDKYGEPWMMANPFATVLQYYKPNDAVRKHVSECNVKNYEYFGSRQIDADDSSLHPKNNLNK